MFPRPANQPAKSRSPAHIPLILLLFVGLAAGFINGLLGAGGGIVLVFVLAAALDGRDVFANAIAVTLPVTLLSAIRYAMAGRLVTDGFPVLILPALLGGAAGAWLLDRIDQRLTRRLFAALIIWSGFNMLRT